MSRLASPAAPLALSASLLLSACGGGGGGGGEEGPGGALREKARAHDARHLEHHQPHYGATMSAIYADDDLTEVESYIDGGDSTMWTGTYLGSQAMRYAVTGEARARANVLRSADVLHHHLLVTGKPGLLARYRAPADAPGVVPCSEAENERENDRCHVETSGPYAGDLWRGNVSRDQYTGWFFGLTMAHDLVPDERMRATIRDDFVAAMDFIVSTGYRIIDLDGEPTTRAPQVLPPFAAAWHLMTWNVAGREQDLEAFRRFVADEELFALSSYAFFNRYTEFYGNNLGHVNFYNLERLSRGMPEHEVVVRVFEEQVHPWLHLEHNAWFEAIHESISGVEDEARAQIVQDLSDFRPPPNRFFGVEPPPAPPDPVSVLLFGLQESVPLLGDLIGDLEVQAARAYPVPFQCSTDFLWQRNPFRFECRSENLRFVDPGVDYLAAYWLARYEGLVELSD